MDTNSYSLPVAIPSQSVLSSKHPSSSQKSKAGMQCDPSPPCKKVLQSMAIILQTLRTSFMTFSDDATNDKYGNHVGENYVIGHSPPSRRSICAHHGTRMFAPRTENDGDSPVLMFPLYQINTDCQYVGCICPEKSVKRPSNPRQ